jgi:uncharacterized protein
MQLNPHPTRAEPFYFSQAGVRLVSDLHLPDSSPVGLAILSGPLTSVRRQATDAYARALAACGYAALSFDHRYFGDSGGAPRQLENPFAKVEDICSAGSALLAYPGFAQLPLFALGICAGAGYMARAVASDGRFAAFAGIAGVYGAATPESIAAASQRIARGRKAEAAWQETGVAATIPAVAADNGDVAMPLTEAFEYYGTSRGMRAGYVNGFAVQSLIHTSTFDSQGAAEEIKVPTVIIHSERALAPSLARAFSQRLTAPNEVHWLNSQGQIDFYDDPTLIAQATELAASVFNRVRAGRFEAVVRASGADASNLLHEQI